VFLYSLFLVNKKGLFLWFVTQPTFRFNSCASVKLHFQFKEAFMNVKTIAVTILALCLTACGGERVIVPVDPTPNLLRFDIVDSFGVDTALSTRALEIDPRIDSGQFDLFWKVNSLEDYNIYVHLNNYPDTRGAQLIYAETCGAGLACDQAGGVTCKYTNDPFLSCNYARAPKDIFSWFLSRPQKLYLVFEVCDIDSSYCAPPIARSVWML
jgi:hypothetical protein